MKKFWIGAAAGFAAATFIVVVLLLVGMGYLQTHTLVDTTSGVAVGAGVVFLVYHFRR